MSVLKEMALSSASRFGKRAQLKETAACGGRDSWTLSGAGAGGARTRRPSRWSKLLQLMATVALAEIHHVILGADFWNSQRISPRLSNKQRAPSPLQELFWDFLTQGCQNMWGNSRWLWHPPFPVTTRWSWAPSSQGFPRAALQR